MIVDIVTDRKANLHAQLLGRVAPGGPAADEALYAGAYRPARRDDQTSLEVWYEALQPGQPLPVLPLWLRGGYGLPLDLGLTYEKTIVKQRVLDNGS